MITFTASTTLYTIECPACHRPYAINSEMREAGESWRCPYLDCAQKHSTWHRAEKSTEELLRDEIAARDKEIVRQKENVEWQRKRRDEAQAEAEHFRKSRDGVRGALVKTKKRIAADVCPCCNRHFPGDKMGKHIKTKHPTYVCENAAP